MDAKTAVDAGVRMFSGHGSFRRLLAAPPIGHQWLGHMAALVGADAALSQVRRRRGNERS